MGLISQLVSPVVGFSSRLQHSSLLRAFSHSCQLRAPNSHTLQPLDFPNDCGTSGEEIMFLLKNVAITYGIEDFWGLGSRARTSWLSHRDTS